MFATRREVNPKSSWANIINQLNSLDLFSLPDYTDVKGFPLGTDGSQVMVEVATKKMYRFYRYPEPYNIGQDNIKEARKIKDIMRIIEIGMGLNIYSGAEDK